MRRISSSPVFRCSGFSSRTHEARSVHCSKVSSEERKPADTPVRPVHRPDEDQRTGASPSRICRALVCKSRASVCCSITSIFSVSWL